jgi:outer membrane protein assembly factor BamB
MMRIRLSRSGHWMWAGMLLASHWTASLATRVAADDWPQFRGPDGQGHSAEHGLPLAWSDTDNVVWKTPIAGLGWSSPVVRGRQIWLTTAIEEEGSLRAICLDATSGKIARDVEVFRKRDLGPINPKNSHASPTPYIDGDRVFVHFGAHGTACLSTRGDVLWRNEELEHDHRHGPAGSPVVWRDLVILNCDGADRQFVVALDRETGRTRWRTDRPSKMAYATPLVVSFGGVDQLVSPGAGQVTSYDPATGREIWQCRHGGDSVVMRPVVSDGMVFVSSGYGSTALYAFGLESRGEVLLTDAVWTLRRGVPYDPSPLIVGDELYLVSDQGVVSCLDLHTGKQHWQARLIGAFSASPLACEGSIYITNEEGLTTVIEAGKKLKKLAENQIEGRTLASLATSDQAIFLRTDKALYRIASPQGATRSPQPIAGRPKPTANRQVQYLDR